MTKPHTKTTQTSGLLGLIMAQPYVLLMFAPLFWGGNIVAGKLAVGQIDPYLLLVGRWAGATMLLLIIALPHLRRDWPKVRPALPLLSLYGILGYATFNILMYRSAYFTAAVNASIEQAAIPVMVLIANFLIFKVRVKFLQIVGLLLTIAGVLWVATHGEPARILALDVNIGDGMVLIACVLYAAYSLALRYRPDIHWLTFILVAAAAAFATSLVFQLLLGGGFGKLLAEIPRATPLGWACILYVMTFPSIISQLFYARGVQLVGPNRASIFINLLPVYGTILSVIIVGESFELYHVVASVLVVAGIVLAEYSVHRKSS